MKLDEYQEIALNRMNPIISKPNKESMRYCCMGLLEETGEIVSELRKPLYKGNFHEKNLDKENLKGEIGDLIWYMALACRNNDIDINSLDVKDYSKGNDDRKEIIKNGINLGRQSGIIVKRYLKCFEGKIEKEKLEKSLKKQYKKLVKLTNELNISMDEVLQTNIEKVTKRYNKDGKANITDEKERDER